MSDKTILSQRLRLNEQLNGFRKSMDKFAESCTKIVEKYGLSSDETECEQPYADTISRQDAINLIERYCDNGCEIAEDKWCPDCQQSKFAEMIKALPQSPSRPQWIPVTERLPEECGNYLVSGGGNLWICEWIGSGWVNSVRNPVVESWMPLPEPYQVN